MQFELPDEEKPQPGASTKPSKPNGTQAGTGKAKVEGKEEAGKKLSDEERKLLERMGIAGGGEVDLDNKKKPASEAVASGPALNSNQLMKVVQDNKVQLQRCYETALRASGGRQDGTIKITVSAVVGTSGVVKQVTTQGTGLGNMTDCMKQAVKRWRFPQSGGESEFAFPLVFQPGA
jgi:hypothetical protein